jgi:hypothetical protein
MAQYIDKSAVIAEINNRIDICNIKKHSCPVNTQVEAICDNKIHAYKELLSFIDTLEVKEADTWHLQEKENIYDAVKDWSLHTFVCIMKNGTIQRFTGNMDEDCEGHINVHINGVSDDYDDVEDIVKWTELT